MKNVIKMLGIIALLAIIGLVVSCGTDPEDQTQITVTGFPAEKIDTLYPDGLYGFIIISESTGLGSDVGWADVAKLITDGSLTNKMADEKGEAFGKNDNYFVKIGIGDTAEKAKADAMAGGTFTTPSKVAVAKGPDNSYSLANDFTPPATTIFKDPPKTPEQEIEADHTGTYKVTYKLGSADQEEFIELSKTKVSIYEKTAAGAKDTNNYLDFVINKDWVFSDPPSTDYTKGYKFTGYIEKGAPVVANSTDTYVYGGKTAPGFVQAVITNKTEAWMYIYFKADGSFVRTVFNKDAATDDKTLITGNETPTPKVREYKK